MNNKIKLGIMQPYFFPYIGYFQLINAVDTYVIYDDVNYIKGGWINRNYILIGNMARRFNLFLIGASPNKLINEISINPDPRNMDKALKTIEMNYRKAPNYNNFFPILENILSYRDTNLACYLYNSLYELCKYMGINTKLILSSQINKNNLLKAEDKVLEICRILNANEYYNAIGGTELYSKKRFFDNGITLRFLKSDNVEYKQFKNQFVPNLSIIDVLMFNNIDQTEKILTKYTLL